MKRTLAMIGWLMVASASYGADGQHTGVGGNPLVPPPNSSSSAASHVQSLLIPSLLFLLPDWMILPEATEVDTSGDQEKSQEQTDASSTQ